MNTNNYPFTIYYLPYVYRLPFRLCSLVFRVNGSLKMDGKWKMENGK